ncbi:MAG: glycosyltransferase [Saccharofermentanales bacterium]
MTKILITGKDSYIGTSFEKWCSGLSDKYSIDTIEMRDDTWKAESFAGYDVVFHVAGIAHVSDDPGKKDLYYRVNRDLAIETAAKAKADGVRQFIFMSSIIIYGDSGNMRQKRVIGADTAPGPSNFYGDSKLQAEEGILRLQDDSFGVVVLRPPMIYGKGSKGNYPLLVKLARMFPVFPDVDNERSMLYIGNLCEFIRLMIDNEERGVFFPQNRDYVRTADMIKFIAEAHGKRAHFTKAFNWLLRILGRRLGIVNKAFGNMVYAKGLSEYKDEYRLYGLRESIFLTENGAGADERAGAAGGASGNGAPGNGAPGNGAPGNGESGSGVPGPKRKVLILVNHDVVIYNFRKELVERLVSDGAEVHLSSPYGKRIDELKAMGCHYIDTEIDRRGTSIFRDMKLLFFYRRLMKDIRPDIVLTYTIKCNIYGGMASKAYRIPYIANITGLGSAVGKPGLMSGITVFLYKIAFRRISVLFFQNTGNMAFFAANRIAEGRHRLIPGSGVNLAEHKFEEYPPESDTVRFLFIGRIMKEKGIEELIDAAVFIKEKYAGSGRTILFDAIGFCEDEYKEKAASLEKNGAIRFYGTVGDVHSFIRDCNAVVLPSYHEGMANVLLEGASTGRPVLASAINGCIETFDEGVSGFGFMPRNSADLEDKLIRFIELPYEKKKEMGRAGRAKMEAEFDRNVVVAAYMDEINRICG